MIHYDNNIIHLTISLISFTASKSLYEHELKSVLYEHIYQHKTYFFRVI